MQQVALEYALWVSGLAGEMTLMFVLLRKGRWRHFPAFTTLIALNMCATSVLFPIARWGSLQSYTHLYWAYSIMNILVQFVLIAELASIVLRPTGSWVRDARQQFLSWGAIGALVALALAYLVAPPAPTMLLRLELRADLFTSLLICELVIAVSLASNRLGLGWKNHVMAIGQGLTCWSTIAVIIDSIHSYFGNNNLFNIAEAVKTLAYIGALGYWCVQLWHEEPVRQPISPELRKYIVALHHRVQYDLGEAER